MSNEQILVAALSQIGRDDTDPATLQDKSPLWITLEISDSFVESLPVGETLIISRDDIRNKTMVQVRYK